MKSVRERETMTAGAKLASGGSRARPRPRAEAQAAFSSEDLERFVQANSGLLTFMGLTLGVFVSRKFFVLPLAVALTLAQEMAKEKVRRLSR